MIKDPKNPNIFYTEESWKAAGLTIPEATEYVNHYPHAPARSFQHDCELAEFDAELQDWIDSHDSIWPADRLTSCFIS